MALTAQIKEQVKADVTRDIMLQVRVECAQISGVDPNQNIGGRSRKVSTKESIGKKSHD